MRRTTIHRILALLCLALISCGPFVPVVTVDEASNLDAVILSERVSWYPSGMETTITVDIDGQRYRLISEDKQQLLDIYNNYNEGDTINIP